MMAVLANTELRTRLIDYGITLTGVAVLAVWLLQTSLGRTSLAGSKPRRNQMPFLAPFVVLYVWLAGPPVVGEVMMQVIGRANALQQEVAVGAIAYDTAAVVAIVLILLMARVCFARGIKGFGLRARRIPRDVASAILCLLAVWPLVITVLIVVQHVGQLQHGPSYRIPEHQALKDLAQAPSTALRALLVVTAAVLAPVQEEMLFRGIIQTIIGTYTGRPWLAIGITSTAFAAAHYPNVEHMPALFVLAMGLGYSYEKSGSLWQPIFMHALFNGTAIVSNLTG